MWKHLTFAAALLALAPAAQAAEWAAQAVINAQGYAGAGPVQWGKTSEEAGAKAVAACKKRYPACGQNAATANVAVHKIFVTTCCNQDSNCQVVAPSQDEAAGRAAARAETIKNVKAAGYPAEGCHIVAVYATRSGKKLKN